MVSIQMFALYKQILGAVGAGGELPKYTLQQVFVGSSAEWSVMIESNATTGTHNSIIYCYKLKFDEHGAKYTNAKWLCCFPSDGLRMFPIQVQRLCYATFWFLSTVGELPN